MRWFTTAEAGKQIGASATTVRERIRSGELVAANIGSEARPMLRVSSESIDRFMSDRRVA